MSYCGPRWISLYHHGRLINNANLLPARVCVDYPWWRDIVLHEPTLFPERWLPDPPPDPIWRKRIVEPEPVISIIGVIHPDDVIEIRSVMRLDAVREIPGGQVTGLTADLLGADGRVMASATVYRVTSFGQGCGCGGQDDDRHPHVFQAYLANAGPGAALRIRRGEKEVWTRRAPAVEPRIVAFKARLKKPDQLQVGWRVNYGEEYGPEHWLQWSADRGKTWNALTTGLRGTAAVVDASGLPSGRVLIRMLAGDGFYTAESKPVAVVVPRRAATVSILTPRDGQTLVTDTPMRLWGVATRSTGDPVPERSVRWLLDGQEVERSLDTFISAPAAGEHRLALVVTVDGKRAEHAIRFKTVKVPEAPEQTG